MIDLAIRGGLIVDGSGLPGFRGDIGVHEGRIVSVGQRVVDAAADLDAMGLVVAPGFVDPHTHFDAQLLFDPLASPMLEHGVTTVVTGNCSLSLAPMRANDRRTISAMFQQIEEMSDEALEAVPWDWGEEFGAMLEAIQRDVAVNVAPIVGHSALRMYVMGGAAQGRAATETEVSGIVDALRACLDAGATGMSTSYNDIDPQYCPVPSRWSSFSELDALCGVLGEYGRILQVVHEHHDTELTISRIEMLAELSLRHNIATTLSPLFHRRSTPEGAERIIAAIDRAWADGARVWIQVQVRPMDVSFTLARRSLMYLFISGWWTTLGDADVATKMALLQDPATRRRLVDGLNNVGMLGMAMDVDGIIVKQVVHNRNRHYVGRRVGDIASERGVSPGDALIDIALEDELGTWFLRQSISHDDADAVAELLTHPGVLVGASDAGAHSGTFASYGDTGLLLSRFVREGGYLTLEEAVKRITFDPSRICGFKDRGLLAPGYAADVVLFDPATIDRGPEVYAEDPTVGGRWTRASVGVHATIVNGALTWTRTGGYEPARAGKVGGL